MFSFPSPRDLYNAVGVHSELAHLYAACVMGRPVAVQHSIRKALQLLATKPMALLFRPELGPAVAALAERYQQRVRELADWKPKSNNAFRQLVSLVQHLFDQYGNLPAWLLNAWTQPSLVEDGVNLPDLTLHLGWGRSLRSFAGLPVKLSKRLEHGMRQAPAGCTFREALRYAQLAARDALEWWGLVMESRLGRAPLLDDDFWLSVVDFFVAAPMVDPRHFGPVCDWIHQKRSVGIGPEPPQPGFSLKGRSMASVLAQAERWHQGQARERRRLGEVEPDANHRWTGLPVADFVDGPVRIEQLLTYGQLVAEGRALHHCVATYLQSCRQGRCGIFSLTVDGARALTLEVDASRKLVQVRGKHNRWMTAAESKWVNQWLDEARLVLSRHVHVAG
ncbi:PcfJ domain-containing protein [Hymenobacter properus]|uniref:PcfJ domain-containing protein n=1 Tax=Hymenobacter properus TaxID=2791026 RepID=A0A931BKZ9_9BACT|nr:PcfJ domain-containing protein [Hymenobacter properus]MBF9143272.1 PcfJ domain-containing protein [Hymenobacter properus]MBR7722082.1 PcfJ domain-containing protein [Microvirga sp. SRT04]